jgi:hypothetical protein
MYVTYTNPHFWIDLNRTLHIYTLRLKEVVGYVWTPQYLTLFDLFDLLCQKAVQNPAHNMAAGPRVIATELYPWSSRRHLRQESSVTALYPWYSRRYLRQESSVTALYPWYSRRHLRQESSVTALYPWYSRRHLRQESSVRALYPWNRRRQMCVLQVHCTIHRQGGEENGMDACQ